MIGEFEVIPEEYWFSKVHGGVENAKYIGRKIEEPQMEKQTNYEGFNTGIWGKIKDYIVNKVMDWGDVEMIEEDLNLDGYGEALLDTYRRIGDRCVTIRYYDDNRSFGLRIMNTPEEKKEFMGEYNRETMMNFI